jgi:hypothetical protein
LLKHHRVCQTCTQQAAIAVAPAAPVTTMYVPQVAAMTTMAVPTVTMAAPTTVTALAPVSAPQMMTTALAPVSVSAPQVMTTAAPVQTTALATLNVAAVPTMTTQSMVQPNVVSAVAAPQTTAVGLLANMAPATVAAPQTTALQLVTAAEQQQAAVVSLATQASPQACPETDLRTAIAYLARARQTLAAQVGQANGKGTGTADTGVAALSASAEDTRALLTEMHKTLKAHHEAILELRKAMRQQPEPETLPAPKQASPGSRDK